MDPFRPPPEGPPQAGGDPAPGNVAITRLPEAGVREHPAPLGALRQVAKDIVKGDDIVREHPAPLGALRHDGGLPGQVARSGQGAPRTARCIKTPRPRPAAEARGVREHPAPLGALRPSPQRGAPQLLGGQGAPRTARCIKAGKDENDKNDDGVREHPAPLGALRRVASGLGVAGVASGSTPHR